jgi:hypothetical protein
VVQYFTTDEGALRNRELIEQVLGELAARDPGGVEYQVLMFDDGVGFMHVVATAPPTRSGTARPITNSTVHSPSVWPHRRS